MKAGTINKLFFKDRMLHILESSGNLRVFDFYVIMKRIEKQEKKNIKKTGGGVPSVNLQSCNSSFTATKRDPDRFKNSILIKEMQ